MAFPVSSNRASRKQDNKHIWSPHQQLVKSRASYQPYPPTWLAPT